ncbi:MAG TPA: iron-sulfur cluster assembly protein, partial [Streptosporangiaceae bacterium]
MAIAAAARRRPSVEAGVPVDVLDMGLVKDLRLDGGTAYVELIVTSPLCTQIGLIIERVQDVLKDVDGVGSVERDRVAKHRDHVLVPGDTPHVVPRHEEHRGAMLSRPQPGHRVPALLSAERIE